MRARLIADLHLHEWREFSSVDGEGLNSRLNGQVECFRELCNSGAGESRPNLLILAGDMVHKRGAMTHQVGVALRQCLTHASENFQKVLAIPGNHDFPLKEGAAWLHAMTVAARGLSNVQVANGPEVVSVPGGVVALVPWMPSKEAFIAGVEKVAQEVKGKASLLVTHVAVTGATGDNGWLCTEGVSLDQLHPEAFGGVFLGDFHSTQQLASNVWYIGSPMSHNFGDNHAEADKGALDVEVTTKGVSLDFVPSGAPLFIKATSIEEAKEHKAAGNFVRFVASDSSLAQQAQELGLAVEYAPPPKTTKRLNVAPDSSPGEVLEAWLDQQDPSTFDQCDLGMVEEVARGVIGEVGSTVSERGGLLDLELVTAENFMGYAQLSVSLKDRGLVLLEGDNRDTDTAKSNGSGKSTLVEVVVYGLFGKTLKGVPVAGLMKVGAKSMSVLLTITVEGGRVVTIKRSRTTSGGSFEWYLDGKPQGAADPRESQRELERVIGWSYELFKQAAIFGQGVDRLFSTCTDAERKELLESLCSGDRFDPLLEKAKENLTFTSNVLAGKKQELDKATRGIETALAEAQEAQTRADTFHEQQKLKAAQLEKEADQVGHEVAGLIAAHKEKAEQVSKLAETLKEVGTESEEAARLRAEAEGLGDLGAEQTKAHRDQLEKEAEIKQLTKEWNAATEACQDVPVAGEVCPECEQKIEGKHAQKVKKERAKKEEDLARKLASAEDELVDLRKKHQQAVARSEAQRKLRDQADQAEREFQRNLSGLRQDLHTLNTAAESLASQVESRQREGLSIKQRAQEALQIENTWEQVATSKRERVATLEASVPGLEDEVKFLSSVIPAMEYVVKLFGTQGLKTFLFDTLAPTITEKANEALQVLSDGAIKLKVSTAGNGSRQQILLEVVNEIGAPCFEGNSGGEKRKVDLALCWAISSMVESKTNCLFIDEALDALDDLAGDRAVRLIQTRQQTRKTIVNITHKEGLKEYFDNVWTVVRSGRSSQLVGA